MGCVVIVWYFSLAILWFPVCAKLVSFGLCIWLLRRVEVVAWLV